MKYYNIGRLGGKNSFCRDLITINKRLENRLYSRREWRTRETNGPTHAIYPSTAGSWQMNLTRPGDPVPAILMITRFTASTLYHGLLEGVSKKKKSLALWSDGLVHVRWRLLDKFCNVVSKYSSIFKIGLVLIFLWLKWRGLVITYDKQPYIIYVDRTWNAFVFDRGAYLSPEWLHVINTVESSPHFKDSRHEGKPNKPKKN